MKNKYHCKDCGKEISKNAKRCKSCAQKKELNNNYIDNKTNKIYYCSDCGKQISLTCALYGFKRCRKCADAQHSLKMTGKGNGMYNKYHTKNSKLKMSKKQKLRLKDPKDNPMFGKHHTIKSKLKNSLSQKLEKHWNWQGGSSFEPYSLDWTVKLREKIRQRDNYTCQHCGMTEKEHSKKYNQVLHVHHINYNKMNCKEDNLITTCNKCNTQANFDRDYWYAYYTYIMENNIYV